MLQKRGGFHPFGAAIATDGEISQIAGYPGEEHPESQEVTQLLLAGLKAHAERGTLRAAGICVDVRTIPPGHTEKLDAICARLEHKDGEAIDVLLPYRRGVSGQIEYGELFASEGTRHVFAEAG